jgi:hypothetical protein
MFKYIVLFGVLIVFAAPLDAVVIRHDVSKERYIATERPDALVNMLYDGHGLLIAPEWVITVGHLIFDDYRGEELEIGGKKYRIDHVILHEGYSRPPKGIFSGYSGPSQAYLRANHDVALIKLNKAVDNVKPIPLYRANDEQGSIVTLIGKGNTGNGVTGQKQKTRGTLRLAHNQLTAAKDQWLTYRFDQGEEALPLEGIQGDGDSGGPVIIEKDGTAYLAGLASWDVYDGDIADFQGGLYGMSASVVRISYYVDWIEKVMSWDAEKQEASHYKL